MGGEKTHQLSVTIEFDSLKRSHLLLMVQKSCTDMENIQFFHKKWPPYQLQMELQLGRK